MPKRLCTLTLKGKQKDWSFEVMVDTKYLKEWQEDGLEIYELSNVIPAWWVSAGFPIKLWCFMQDVFNFKNPFKSKL